MNKDKIKILKFYKCENNTYTLVKKSENRKLSKAKQSKEKDYNSNHSNSNNPSIISSQDHINTNRYSSNNRNDSSTRINIYKVEGEYENIKSENKGLLDKITHLKEFLNEKDHEVSSLRKSNLQFNENESNLKEKIKSMQAENNLKFKELVALKKEIVSNDNKNDYY